MKKKGLSQIVSTVLLILITVSAVAGVWMVIDSFVNEGLGKAKSCQSVIGQIELNNEYTCYNSTSKQMLVSILRKDFDLDSIFVSVSYGTENVVFELTNNTQTFPDVTFYSGATEISMPPKEGGRTYIVNRVGMPERVLISPKVDGIMCDISDSLEDIPTCL